jgi:dihydrofolate reductase
VSSGVARPTVCVYIAVSLDGYIARADGRIDWLDAVQLPGENYGYAEFFAAIDTIVPGRATYDEVLTFGDRPFEGRPVVVLTHRPLASKHDERGHAGALGPLLQSLAAAGARCVHLDGGEAIRHGLSDDLVDEMTLSTVPILPGAGRPLFDRGLPESGWTLLSTRGFASGLVQSRYRRCRH